MTVREYLQRKHFDYQEKGNEAVMNCPFCGDTEKKFGVSLRDGAFNCLHLSRCGKKGSFVDLQRELGDEPVSLGNYEFTPKPIQSYTIPKIKSKALSEPVLKYLQGRGFSEKTIKHFQIGESSGKVMLPFIKNKIAVNAKYRSITDKHDMKMESGAEPCLFNHDNAGEDLIITEGEFDAMALYEYGYDACSIPNGAQSDKWVDVEFDWMEKFKTIYLCYDNDKAGIDGMKNIITRLGDWRCKIVTFPRKDANDCLMEGFSKEAIKIAFDEAKEIAPAMLTSPSDYAERIVDMFMDPEKMEGIKTFLDSLNTYLKGWRAGEVTIWSGQSGSGKTTMLIQHMLHLADQKVNTCIASMEMSPSAYLTWGIQQYTKQFKPSKDSILSALSWMNGKIFVVNTVEQIDSEELIRIFTFANRKFGVTHFIIDSLLKVKLPGVREYDEQKKFIDDLTQFAMKYNSHVHLVAHQKKLEKDDSKPGKYAVKGSIDITNLASNVILINRIKNNPGVDANFALSKNRIFGDEFNVDLKFDKETRLFREA